MSTVCKKIQAFFKELSKANDKDQYEHSRMCFKDRFHFYKNKCNLLTINKCTTGHFYTIFVSHMSVLWEERKVQYTVGLKQSKLLYWNVAPNKQTWINAERVRNLGKEEKNIIDRLCAHHSPNPMGATEWSRFQEFKHFKWKKTCLNFCVFIPESKRFLGLL